MREQRITYILITALFDLGKVRYLEHDEVMMVKTDTTIIAGNYRPLAKENAVLVFAAPEDQEKHPDLDYGELHEATCRWFVDKRGFSTRSFVCVDACKETGMPGPIAKVTFIDDGIVMAKLQGIIE